jgi:hypothetical protein
MDRTALTDLLSNGTARSLVGSKQLTLAFGGLYIASTTLQAKPLLVWEGQSGYPKYYVPIESLHPAIKAQIGGHTSNGAKDGADIKLETVDTVKGKNDNAATIERLSISSRSTTWVRFTEGLLNGFVRFESKDIGTFSNACFDTQHHHD